MDRKTGKMQMLTVCQTCLRNQVRYNIDYLNCSKNKTGRYCLDCPSRVYKKCPLMNKTLKLLPPGFVQNNKIVRPSRMNRLSNQRFTSDASDFQR